MEELFNQEKITLHDFVPPVFFKLYRKIRNLQLSQSLLDVKETHSVHFVLGIMVMGSILLGVLVSTVLPSTVANLVALMGGKYSVKLTADAYQKIYTLEVQRYQMARGDNAPIQPLRQGAVLGATDKPAAIKRSKPSIRRITPIKPYSPYENTKRKPSEKKESSLFDIWERPSTSLSYKGGNYAQSTEKPSIQKVLGATSIRAKGVEVAEYYSYF